MPRQIEAKRQDGWKLWNEAPLPTDRPWRYVGGVLECGERGGRWGGACLDQSLTVDEALRIDPHARFRLRPYDDAESATQQRRHDRLVASGHLQAEQQKQHGGRHAFADMADELHRRQQAAAADMLRTNLYGPIPAPQRPADASVAPAGDPRPLYGPVDWRALYGHATRHANELSDTCGTLRTELDEAYAKIGRLTREVERLGRKKR